MGCVALALRLSSGYRPHLYFHPAALLQLSDRPPHPARPHPAGESDPHVGFATNIGNCDGDCADYITYTLSGGGSYTMYLNAVVFHTGGRLNTQGHCPDGRSISECSSLDEPAADVGCP